MQFPSFTKVYHHESYPSISPDRPDLSAKGKVVLVTGAGSGIGQNTAFAFAKAKAKVVVVCGRRSSVLEETKAKILDLGLGTEVIIHVLDVSSEDSVDTVFQAVHEHAGPIDIVVQGAGQLSEAGSIKDTSFHNFWDAFDINVKGAFLISRAFLRHCVSNDGKQRVLILMSSVLAHLPAHQVATTPASYGISKMAEAKLAEYVAAENPDVLRVYAIQPGVIDTPMFRRSMEMASEEVRTSLVRDDPDLPANFMLWLASSRGACIPSGRFLWINWDVDELEARSEEIKDDPYLLSMVLGGWPFSKQV